MSSDRLPANLPAVSPLRSHKDLWTSLLVYKANMPPIAAGDSPLQVRLTQGRNNRSGSTRLDTFLLASGVAQMLRSLTGAGRPAPPSAAVIELLQGLSRDDFGVMRESPPLLYRNHLTASVPRFYSSEEMGHVLWPRLYFENTPSRSGGVM